FVAKSAQQMGEKIPRMPITKVITGGLKAAPTVGVIVGTQMGVQKVVEKALTKNDPSFTSMLASSLIVGGVSAPALAAFNAQTMGRTIRESLKALSIR